MGKLKILLCGDSFAADYSLKVHGTIGWPNFLGDRFDLTNLATAGASEYRILKQLQSVDLEYFDHIIVSHTSPYRIYVKDHPVHKDDLFYKNCDLIYSDSVEFGLKTIQDWFENYFDLEYATHIHHLIMKEIHDLSNTILHIGHMEISAPPKFDYMDFSDIWKKNKGLVNHYNDRGNEQVYQRLLSYLTRVYSI